MGGERYFVSCNKKIEQVVSLIAEKENKAFEDAYSDFLSSQAYKALQNTNSLMWFENAEFIAGEYFSTSPPPPQSHTPPHLPAPTPRTPRRP
ncbi:hypothetical protein R83H12_03024 [Fibrobacteria bacterium R8-3-H12]